MKSFRSPLTSSCGPAALRRSVKSSRGFTLIELLVSMSIFAVLTTLAVTNYRAGGQSDELRSAGQLLASAVRRAQTMALSGQTANICAGGTNDKKLCTPGASSACPGGSCLATTPQGYGIHLSTNSSANQQYLIFADVNGNRTYDAGEELRTESVSPGKHVIISGVSPAASGSLDIIFEPPKPKAWFNGSTATAIASITLKHAVTNATRDVTVNLITGQVSAN